MAAKADSGEDVDLVSEEGLKREANEFDIENILFLDLSDRGLTSVGVLPQCSSLRILNLSCNQLTSVSALCTLSALEELDLSANQISSLDGLENLESLRKLDLPGNNVTQLESLLPLAALARLRTLSLKLPGSKLTNPVCCDPGYDSFVRETFPHLVWLDMEKVAGAGAEFYSRCRELDRWLENGREEEGERETGRQHRQAEAVEDPLVHFSLNDERASDMISKLLSECSETSERLQQHISVLRRELSQQQRTQQL